MNDLLQPAKRLLIGEYLGPQCYPVNRAARRDYVSAKLLLDLMGGFGSCHHQLVNHLIRVNAVQRAELKQHRPHGGLAAGDGAGQAEDAWSCLRILRSHSSSASSMPASNSAYRSVSSVRCPMDVVALVSARRAARASASTSR